jgi:hypothetical protein
MANPEQQARKALKVFMEMLADSAKRQEFTQDPVAYIDGREGVHFNQLPQALQDFVRSCQNDAEGVACLGRLQTKLDESQLLERQNSQTPERFATLSKF